MVVWRPARELVIRGDPTRVGRVVARKNDPRSISRQRLAVQLRRNVAVPRKQKPGIRRSR